MLLRRTFPLPASSGGGGGGGALAATVRNNPLQKYNPSTLGYSSATQRVFPTGGTPPYTYAWSRQSGSTDIGGGGGSAETSEFSASGNGDPVSSQSAVWRVTVTDDATDTVDVDFTVAFYFGLEEP